MPDIARLSDTAETSILLMSLGDWSGEAAAHEKTDLPHEFTDRIKDSLNLKIEELASVTRARALDFNDSIPAVGGVSWVQSALERLHEIANSGPDWDGYGAPRIHSGAIVASLGFLHQVATRLGPRPSIVATGSGNIQFEWRGESYGVDVEIGPDSEYCATLFVKGIETNEWTGDMLTGVAPELAHVIAFGLQSLPN